MYELTDFALIVLVVAGAFSLSILATQLGNHLPVPAPAVFLVAAAVASDLWPVLREDVSVRTVERVAVIALIVVLLNGGMDTGWRRFRAAAGPIMAIGIAGTFITAAVLTGAAHWLLGMDWKQEEILDHRLVELSEAKALLNRPIRRRVMAATGTDRVVYLEDGRPVSAVQG